MEDPISLIALIGLPDRDVTVIKSLIKIIKLSPKASRAYNLVGSDQLGMAHVVFVNGDDPTTLTA